MLRQLALVTGATSGIGESLARLLAQKDFELLLTGRNEEKLRKLQEELQHDVPVEVMQIDLEKSEDCSSLIKAIHTKAPDLVINNAGYGLYGEALTYSTESQKKLLQVNGMAVLEITLEASRTLISKNKSGIILNVSSAAAFQIIPDFAVYTASKAFVNNFSQAFDIEMAPYGVRVLTACPGMVATNFRERAGGHETEGKQTRALDPVYVAEEIWHQIKKKKPLKIIDWKYHVLTFLSHLFPKAWKTKTLRRSISERISPRHFIPIDDDS